MMVTSRTIQQTSVQVLDAEAQTLPVLRPDQGHRPPSRRRSASSIELSIRDTTAVEPVDRPENKNPIR